jgi:hypothetical protein
MRDQKPKGKAFFPCSSYPFRLLLSDGTEPLLILLCGAKEKAKKKKRKRKINR